MNSPPAAIPVRWWQFFDTLKFQTKFQKNMFDNYEPHQFIDKLQFGFKSSRYEIWQNGKLVKQGGSNIISAEFCVETNTTDISIFGTIAATDIKPTVSFDKGFTLHDRLIFVTIPEPSQRDTVAFMSLRQTSGTTRPGKTFENNEPYCSSIFTLRQQPEKITFSFNNPEKLIEFYK